MKPVRSLAPLSLLLCALAFAARGEATAANTITLDEAIQLALEHNKNLLATRTTIEQSLHQETTAGLRPNPNLSVSFSSLPLFAPQEGLKNYLSDNGSLDIGLGYTFELGGKRGDRIAAARDTTAVTRAQVTDAERALIFQVATQFIGVQLANSTVELARDNLKSFENAVEIGTAKYKSGAISENDYLKIKLQLLQFQTDLQAAQLARVQGLVALRQLVGYETVSADYDVAGPFDYRAVPLNAGDLFKLAADNRPDLLAAHRAVTASKSQVELAQANGIQDLTVGVDYVRQPLGGDHTANTASLGVSMPLAIFDRNQGEIARTKVAVTQAELQEAELIGQVKADVQNAYENLQENARIAEYYLSGYLEVAKRSRDISEYAYTKGATSLFDFLDAERSYRSTQLAYRQAIAAHLLAVEQVREAVGTRGLK
jgi:cobalt-zinc-cadmium efflux system outer membrane protein